MRVDIELRRPRFGSIRVDGVDVAQLCQGFRLTGDAKRGTTTLELEIVPATHGATFSGDAAVRVSDDLAAFLVHLGWTPPEPEDLT